MAPRQRPRVVIDYVEAGMGHIVTAQAISDALRERCGDTVEIIDNYSLRDAEDPCLPKYEKFLVGQVKMYSVCPAYNKLQMTAMHIGGVKNSLRIVHSGFYHKETTALIEQYKKLDADVMIFTHYFTLYAAIEYRNKFKPSCKVVLYCPDNNIHGWWDNRVDRLYTNNPLATRDALKNKYPPECIREVFYPTRKAVTESCGTKEEYRELFGIPKDKFAVVIADGVYAKAKAKKIAYELMKSDLPLTICVIAGKNEELLAELEAIKDTTKPNITLLPMGFVKEAPKLYAACDLFVTKAGPNAILDSVMMGTPIIVSCYASDIEKATKNLFVDTKKCGYYIKDLAKIREAVERLTGAPEELATLCENLKFFDKRRNGAVEIAEDLCLLMGM